MVYVTPRIMMTKNGNQDGSSKLITRYDVIQGDDESIEDN